MRIIFSCLAVVLMLLPDLSAFSQGQWTYTPVNLYINALAEDDSSIWIASSGGLYRINKSSRELLPVSDLKDSIGCVNEIVLDGGRMWLATMKGLVQVTGNSFKHCSGPFSPFFTGAITLRGNEVWASDATAIFAYNTATSVWTRYTRAQTGLRYFWIYETVCDKRNNIWCATDSGLVKFDGSQWKSFTTENSILPSNTVTDIAVEKDTVWVSTRGGALKIVNDTWQVFTTKNSPIPFDNLSKVIVDSAGVKFFVGPSGRILSYHNTEWSLFQGDPLLNYTYDLINSKSGLWIAGYSSSLYHISNGVTRKYNLSKQSIPTGELYAIILDAKIQQPIFVTRDILVKRQSNGTWLRSDTSDHDNAVEDHYAQSLAQDTDGSVWTGFTRGGVMHFANNGELRKFTKSNSPLPGDSINSMTIDRDGNKWFATRYGITRYDNSEFTQYSPKQLGGFNSDEVTAIAIDRNNAVWCAVASEGLLIYDKGAWSAIKAADSLPVSHVFEISFDRGNNPWLATRTRGALSLQSGKWIEYSSTSKKLNTPLVTSIAIDSNNVKWLGTVGLGLVRLTDVVTNNYNQSNSDITSDFVYSIAIDKQGKKWLSVTDGIASFDESATGIGEHYSAEEPANATSLFASPNPFRNRTTVSYSIGADSQLRVVLYDILGNKVRTLYSGMQAAGSHTLDIVAEKLGPGTYFCILEINDRPVRTQELICIP